jgi:probable rRNA maturation factor
MIVNHQRRIRIPMEELRKFLARAQRMLRLPADSVTVCLVTDGEIARWNRAYRSKARPTDVLSFPAYDGSMKGAQQRLKALSAAASLPLSPSSGDPPYYLGDIAVAPAVARRNARRFGRKFGDEMRTLILHGLLHLLGYDHETDTGEMDRCERRLRRRLGLA